MSVAYSGTLVEDSHPAHVIGQTQKHIRPGFKRLVLVYLWIVIASGCVVYVEPAPYDALLLGAVILLPLAGLVALPRALAVYLLAICGIAAGGYVASTQAGLVDVPVKHVTITLYLGLTSVVLAAFVAYDPIPHTRLIMSAYVAAALIASIAALVGYFNLVPPLYDILTEFGRARGTFKDPNVLGAFLVPAVLYAMNGMLTGRAPRALLWSIVLVVLFLATLLSFSRGAWLNVFAGLIAYGFLAFAISGTNRGRVKLLVMGVLASLIAVAVLVAIQTVPQVAESLGERATIEQSYDVGPEGRFAGQAKAVDLVASHPLGIGALEFARLHHPEDVHQVYLNMYLNTGWLGGTLYLFLVLTTIAMGLRSILRDRQNGALGAVVLAAFVGMAIEGLVVDTDHWRHFYLIMAVIWGMAAVRPRQRPITYGRFAVRTS